MGSKGIIEFLVATSRDWLKNLHAEEAKRKIKPVAIFPNLGEIFAKIQKCCTEKQIVLFEVAPKSS